MAFEDLHAGNDVVSIYLFQRSCSRENGFKGGKSRKGNEEGDCGSSHGDNEGAWDKD